MDKPKKSDPTPATKVKVAGPTLLPADQYYDLVSVEVESNGALVLNLDNGRGEKNDLIIRIAVTDEIVTQLGPAVEEAVRLTNIEAKKHGHEIY